MSGRANEQRNDHPWTHNRLVVYVVDHWDDLLEAAWQHARIVLILVFSATIFSVVLGIAVQRRPTLRAIALMR